jgi:hypothetical protein
MLSAKGGFMHRFLKLGFIILLIQSISHEASSSTSISEENLHSDLVSRKIFHTCLNRLKESITSFPSIFISYSWDNNAHTTLVDTFRLDLEGVGFTGITNRPGGNYNLHKHTDKILEVDKVILIGSPGLKTKYANAIDGKGGMISQEIDILRSRINKRGVEGIIPILFQGGINDNFPEVLHHLPTRYLMTGSPYFINFFELLTDIFHIEEDSVTIVKQIEEKKEDFLKLSNIPEDILKIYVRNKQRDERLQEEQKRQNLTAILFAEEPKASNSNYSEASSLGKPKKK